MAKQIAERAGESRAGNPFADDAGVEIGGGIAIAQGREIAEAQAMVVMARHFPRNQRNAVDRILNDCTRATLAEAALYAYKRGGEIVSGPSIRLAESIARAWGNLNFGVREVSQAAGVSTVEAYAWDLETNTRASKVFQVKHQRKASGSIKSLDDPRDVYELVANMGARRMRACILAVIPGDVVEAAVQQCELTQTNKEGTTEEQIAKLVDAFAKVGVTREQLVRRIGHKLEACKGGEIFNLRRIYLSIHDGIGRVAEFFEVEEPATPAAAADLSARIRARDVGAPAADAPEAVDGGAQ